MAQNAHISLPQYAETALSILEHAGFEAWLVGGFVRDAVLGREPGDVDIACSALWSESKDAFEASGYRVYETGVAHGTITAMVDGNPIEVTTYRVDGEYIDCRHPEYVRRAKTIEEDLARRDFTMNALAYHPDRGLIDPYGGQADIEAHLIRTVGDPRERFREDALRILRACRFASQLGFDIEPATLEAAQVCKRLLLRVSTERTSKEFELFLLGDYIHDALMKTADTLSGVMPELIAMKGFEQNSPYHIYDVLEHTAYVLQNTPAYPLARWAALFHDIGKPGAYFETEGVGHFYGHAYISIVIAKGAMERLNFSQSFMDKILYLVKVHDKAIHTNARSVKIALREVDGDITLFRALCDLKRADALAKAPNYQSGAEQADRLLEILDEIIETGAVYSRHQLAINGHSVMALGIEPGPRVGELLDVALDAVIDDAVENDHEALVRFLAASLGTSVPDGSTN